MITLRKSQDRGHANFGQIETCYSFSFADYYDPRFMGSSALRVLNQDIVIARSGFPAHNHDNMEILTYVLRGAISHRDNMGNEARVVAGDFQLMSAGTGITHSEHNRDNETLEFLQIWILPQIKNTEPGYQQKNFEKREGLQLIASPDGARDSLVLKQDTCIWRGQLNTGKEIQHVMTGNTIWLQQITGETMINGKVLQAGDGAEIKQEKVLSIHANSDSEFLLFDLP